MGSGWVPTLSHWQCAYVNLHYGGIIQSPLSITEQDREQQAQESTTTPVSHQVTCQSALAFFLLVHTGRLN